MWIAIDFDQTIVQGDKPLPGAKEALAALREAGHKIEIHSCNNYDWIQQVLGDNDIVYDNIWDGTGKPVASAYIDDRAIQFKGDWKQTLDDTLKFVNQREVQGIVF